MEKEYSIVIPVLNEEESIRELIEKIEKSFKGKSNFEVIFVDDGSTDNTLSVLKSLERDKKFIKTFSFRRNLGKSAALMQGFKFATGKYVATLDGDLQDDPSNIKELKERMVKGDLDLVSGWRKNRKDTVFKKISSMFFNKIVSMLFKLKVHDLNGGLKLYKNEVVKELHIYGGMHRFIPIIAKELGFRVGEREILHHPRKYGHSKYKSSKIITEIPDLITIYFLSNYTRRPLHFFGRVGTFIFILGLIVLAYLTWLHFMGARIGTRPLLFLGVLLVLAGIQTIFTGLLADLLVHTKRKDTDYPIKYASS